jgi:hypothetical protein
MSLKLEGYDFEGSIRLEDDRRISLRKYDGSLVGTFNSL